eukprot:COSAG04_NODE_5451_length_1615_cov_4.063984_1_plen_67_part_10
MCVLVMELLMDKKQKTNLRAHMDAAPHKRLDEFVVQTMVFHVLSGLSAMHTEGVIHRDVKPENIALT